MSTNFRLELIEPAARWIYFLDSSREGRTGASEERTREHGSNLVRVETASEMKKKLLALNFFSRLLYKLQSIKGV